MFKFRKEYLLISIILFVIELLIAIYVHDDFIRPYIGDVLVVLLIYCFLKTFWNAKSSIVAVSVLLFAFTIEVMQYFQMVDLFGVRENKVLTIVLGSTFSWEDLFAYLFGFLIIIAVEKVLKSKNRSGFISGLWRK